VPSHTRQVNGMYERFSDRAQKVMQLANQEAQRLDHEYIGTEHILRGLVKEGGGVAADVLKDFGVQLHTITAEVDKFVQKGAPFSSISRLPQTPRAKQVIGYAMEEARNLNHDYVGTEHILLGLLREDEGFAAQVLMNLGLRLEKVRAQIQANPGRFDDESCTRRTSDKSRSSVRQLDDDTKRRVRQLAEELAPLQRAKEDAVAHQDFSQAVQLRDKQDQCWRELQNFNLPESVLTNVNRLVNAWPTKASRFPLLDMLNAEAGKPDPAVVAMLPNPMMPPVKIVVRVVPRYPVSTLKAVLAPDDISSRYFQALVPLISPESVAERKGNNAEMIRLAFSEIGRAESLIYGRSVLLCVVRPTALSENVQEELFAGIHRTNCEFVLFEKPSEVGAVHEKLPPVTKLLET
jgi:hypothetical protein